MSTKIVNEFIRKFSLETSNIDKLDNDASERIYYRADNKIIAYVPKKKGESIYNFINATKILNSIGIKVPRVHIQDNELEILLIDDFGRNVKEWKSGGGIPIKHKTAKDTISALKKLGFK